MNKSEIETQLTLEGVMYSYRGKEKVIFVNKRPSFPIPSEFKVEVLTPFPFNKKSKRRIRQEMGRNGFHKTPQDKPASRKAIIKPPANARPIGRNEACACGSGKKHKHCHLQVNNKPDGKQHVLATRGLYAIVGEGEE